MQAAAMTAGSDESLHRRLAGAAPDSLYTLEGGQAAASALTGRGCTAVVCASGMTAPGALQAARQRGL